MRSYRYDCYDAVASCNDFDDFIFVFTEAIIKREEIKMKLSRFNFLVEENKSTRGLKRNQKKLSIAREKNLKDLNTIFKP